MAGSILRDFASKLSGVKKKKPEEDIEEKETLVEDDLEETPGKYKKSGQLYGIYSGYGKKMNVK